MAWVIVLAAGVFETGFAVLLKLSHGLTRLWPTMGFAACTLKLVSIGLVLAGVIGLSPSGVTP
jgi:quaternary ammonium compound-resistance protein SugE